MVSVPFQAHVGEGWGLRLIPTVAPVAGPLLGPSCTVALPGVDAGWCLLGPDCANKKSQSRSRRRFCGLSLSYVDLGAGVAMC